MSHTHTLLTKSWAILGLAMSSISSLSGASTILYSDLDSEAALGDTITNNGVQFVRDPIYGSVAQFDGSSWVDFSTAEGEDMRDGNSYEGTISVWVKPELVSVNGSPQAGHIFWASNGTSGDGFGDQTEVHLSVSDQGKALFFIGAQSLGNRSTATGTTTITDGQWHHVMATWSKADTSRGIESTVTLWVDGEIESEVTHLGDLNFNFTGRARLGRPSDSRRYYKGLMDEIYIYDGVTFGNGKSQGSAAYQFTSRIPLPNVNLPEEPAYPATVVTNEGHRLMLNHVDVTVSYNTTTSQLSVSEPGWWLINYPLKKIVGLESMSENDISLLLFDKPASELKNWYFRNPAQGGSSVSLPSGPAPFTPSSNPTLVVDEQHPSASDSNPGTSGAPFKTIQAAVNHANVAPGSVIQVRPGIYRESIKFSDSVAGTKEQPITLEGVRDSNGKMPVISANNAAPTNAWTAVPGYSGLWRADNWVNKVTKLSLNGDLVKEGTIASDLNDFEFSNNYSGKELAFPRLDGNVSPTPGSSQLGSTWTLENTNSDTSSSNYGRLDFDDREGIMYLSTWVWTEPAEIENFDPLQPDTVNSSISVSGKFRAGRQTGSSMGSQLNLFRIWVNGELLPASGDAFSPRPRTDYGQSGDTIERVPLNEGWNHVVVALGNYRKSGGDYITVQIGAGGFQASGVQPSDLTAPLGSSTPNFTQYKKVSQWCVLGPLPAGEFTTDETAFYLKLPSGMNPNSELIDAGSRGEVLTMNKDFWNIRGFEIRHGDQYQQNALAKISAAGVHFEHNHMREATVRLLSLSHGSWEQLEEPVVVRGNWFEDPGSLSIGASTNSDPLTAENQNTTVPNRGRALVEYNYLFGNNWSGYPMQWESGAMKFFRTTGWVIRQNYISGGEGPGIWLDFEHFNTRVEGNFVSDVPMLGVGVEASPGPLLFANNVTHNIRSGGAWFKYGVLGWSSARIWTVANSLVTPYGYLIAEGSSDRNTRWQNLPERNGALANNLMSGPTAMHRGNVTQMAGNRVYGSYDSGLQGNTKWGGGFDVDAFEASGQLGGSFPDIDFYSPETGDYHYDSTYADSQAGVSELVVDTQGEQVNIVALAPHDFHGLLRFPEDPIPAGAYRYDRPPLTGATQIELELQDGEIIRLWTPDLTNTPQPNEIAPTGDTYVRGGASSDLNFGADTTMIMKGQGSGDYDRAIAMKFDISGLSNAMGKVFLRLHIKPSSQPWRIRYYDATLSVIGDNWDENAVNWNTLPAEEYDVTAVTGFDNNILNIDITEAYETELAKDGILSLKFTVDAPHSSETVTFHTKEAGPDLQPVLTIHKFIRPNTDGSITLEDNAYSYGNVQDGQGGLATHLSLNDSGTTATLSGNAWKLFPIDYEITEDTVMEVTIDATDVGEIIGVSLDNDEDPTNNRRAFLFGGSTVDGSLHTPWSWTMTEQLYSVGDGPVTYLIPVGKYFTGPVTNLGFIADDDADASTNVAFSNLALFDAHFAQFNDAGAPYSTQDGQGGLLTNLVPSGDASAATLTGNAWKIFPMDYSVTPSTVLEFQMDSSDVGEIIGVALDDNTNPTSGKRVFLVGGSSVNGSNHQNWSWTLSNQLYSAGEGEVRFVIPVGSFFTGQVNHLGLIADDDADASTDITFRNVIAHEFDVGLDNGAIVEIDPYGANGWDFFQFRIENISSSASIVSANISVIGDGYFDIFEATPEYSVQANLGENQDGLISKMLALNFSGAGLAPGLTSENSASGDLSDLDGTFTGFGVIINFSDGTSRSGILTNIGDSDDGDNDLFRIDL